MVHNVKRCVVYLRNETEEQQTLSPPKRRRNEMNERKSEGEKERGKRGEKERAENGERVSETLFSPRGSAPSAAAGDDKQPISDRLTHSLPTFVCFSAAGDSPNVGHRKPKQRNP
ncbi:hypothetical protein niasHT_036504 [Heterodera trifolii]|uniref:Uncharacterized protein n=1 Tax=Heterodera trifolii TaxID=157864 RepID=A0ABD2J4S5_9BILA